MTEAVRTSETSVNFCHTARRNIPEDSRLHTLRRENMKSHRVNTVLGFRFRRFYCELTL
jgi:hypothetical protein